MAFVDDVLDEFDGQLTYQDIYQMTYKELGYLRMHRKEHHPQEAKVLAKALMNGQIPAGQNQRQRHPAGRGKQRPARTKPNTRRR